MEPSTRTDPLELRDVLRPIKARLWLIIICVVGATALTYYHVSKEPKQYRASTVLYIGSTDPTHLTNTSASDRETADLATLVQSSSVAKLAAKMLHFKGNPAALVGAVTATAVTGSDFVDLTAVSGSAQGAATLVNTVANAFVADQTTSMRAEAAQSIVQAQRDLNALPKTLANQTQIGQLVETIQQLQGVEALPSAGIEHIDPASPPGLPFAPDPKKDAIFAFVIALMLSIGGAYGLDRVDRRIRKLAQVEPAYGYPILAAVPRANKPAASAQGAVALPDDVREAFRKLRMNLQLAAIEQPPRTIVVTSAGAREGKSTVIRNLALAYREAGLHVCVVDADLRRPGLAELLNGPMVPGLTDVVVGDATLTDALNRVEADTRGRRILARLASRPDAEQGETSKPDAVSSLRRQSSLHGERLRSRGVLPAPVTANEGFPEPDVGSVVVLPSGPEPANPPVVLGSDQMRAILARLADSFDVVLIDSSPVLAVSDAVPLLSNADGVIVVSRVGMTTTDAAEDLVAQIRRIPGANLLGVVANDVHGRDAGAKSYQYGYGRPQTDG